MKFHQWVFKILKKQNVTDGRTDAHTDARTDGQRENSIPPLKLRFGGGYNDAKLEQESTENVAFKPQKDVCKGFLIVYMQ